MTCCPQLIQNFSNQASMSLAYGDAQKAIYGPQPNVQVYFRDDAGDYRIDEFSEVRITSTNILIYFGGPNTGIVKVF